MDSPYLQDIKFHEHFLHHAVQPYAEFQLVSIPHLTITAGVKDAFFRMNLTQYADGHTIGNLSNIQAACGVALALAANCTATTQHAQNYNSILPSFEANYRINPNASVYLASTAAAASLPSAPSSIPPALRLPSLRRPPSPTPTRAARWSS